MSWIEHFIKYKFNHSSYHLIELYIKSLDEFSEKEQHD